MPRIGRRAFLAALGATGAGFAAGASLGLAGARALGSAQYTVGTGSGSSALRVGVLTDLHLGSVSEYEARVAEALATLRPDVVVLVGDTVDDADRVSELPGFLELLPDVPTFATLGNWEYWGGVEQGALRRTLGRFRIRLLVNEWAELPDGRRVYGVDDLVAGQPSLDASRPDRGALLLSHCPAFRDSGSPGLESFDAIVSGHTHGGQVRFGSWAPVTPPGSGDYVVGKYSEGGVDLVVSSGVGTSVLPVRFGADPEVVLVEWLGS